MDAVDQGGRAVRRLRAIRLREYTGADVTRLNLQMESQITTGGAALKDPERTTEPDCLAAASGDFEAVVERYRPKVFRFALASLRDEDAAGSVTQDCFYKAFRAWPAFRGECSLDTWLMRIAVNLIRDYARNRRLQFWKRLSGSSEDIRIVGAGKTPEAQLLMREQVSSVWRAAGNLPERERTVFLLRFVEEMELLEIASATGMKEGTVKAHLFSAVRKVRKQMGVTI